MGETSTTTTINETSNDIKSLLQDLQLLIIQQQGQGQGQSQGDKNISRENNVNDNDNSINNDDINSNNNYIRSLGEFTTIRSYYVLKEDPLVSHVSFRSLYIVIKAYTEYSPILLFEEGY